MNYTWEFDKLKPVVQFSFEELLEYLTPHIRGYAFKSLASHVPYQQEDLQQECNLILWKCWQKYRNFSNLDFIKLFKCAIHNRMAEIMRIKPACRSKPEASFEDVGVYDLGNGNKTVLDAGFYEREIKRLVEQVGDSTRGKIMARCQPGEDTRHIRLSKVEELDIVEKSLNGE